MEERIVVRTMRPREVRPRRRGEHGVTLIELIVSIVVLGIIGGVIGTIYTVGYATLRPGGPQTRLLASYDLSIIEQDLGQDGARAACIQVPPGGSQYGSCSASKFGQVGCPHADLCFGWPQVSDSSCHVADYMIGTGVRATRTEYVAGTASPLSVVSLTRDVPVTVTVGTPSTVTLTGPTGQPYTWVRSLPVTVTSTGLSNPPSQTLAIHPVATDPAGQAAAITIGGSPC
jgi:prepilin-type N-terminal cleavage/methylation domain-containing protein